MKAKELMDKKFIINRDRTDTPETARFGERYSTMIGRSDQSAAG